MTSTGRRASRSRRSRPRRSAGWTSGCCMAHGDPRSEEGEVSDIHVVAAPRLHMRLHEVRRELDEIRDLARRLAEQLDRHVDARHGRRAVDARATGAALLEARQQGLLQMNATIVEFTADDRYGLWKQGDRAEDLGRESE